MIAAFRTILFSRPFAIAMAVAAVLAASGHVRASTAVPVDQAFKVRAERAPGSRVKLDFEIAPGTHLYRDQIAVTSGGKAVPVTTPAGRIEDDPSFGRTEVYYNHAKATFVEPGSGPVEVRYQGCEDKGICYPPVRRTLDLSTLTFSRAKTGPSLASGSGWSVGGSTKPAQEAAAPEKQGENWVASPKSAASPADRVARSGCLLLLTSFFGFGVLLAFTPCVLPMYPILGGMLAREGERLSAGRGLVISLTYVLAMAGAFGLLGIATAWSGGNLQVALQSPVAIGIMAAVFVLLAASMFGLFEMNVPPAIADRLTRRMPGRRGSLSSAAVLGFTSALIVGPCVTPPLAAALVYVALTGDVARGAAALFALGLGQGLPLILFGTFGAGLLPRTGPWMQEIKVIFGFVFLGAAVWMVSRVVEPRFSMLAWAVLLVTAGVFAGAFDLLRPGAGRLARLGKAGGLLAVLAGGTILVGAAAGGTEPLRPLASLAGTSSPASAALQLRFDKVASRRGLSNRLKQARARGKPAFVYFTAAWCVSCRTIDRDVLPAEKVRQAFAGYSWIEVDLTSLDADKRALMKSLDVVGPPTMLFYRPSDESGPAGRLVGEVSAAGLADTARSLSIANDQSKSRQKDGDAH